MADVQVTVLFFAKSRELAGQKSSLIEFNERITARQLFNKIIQIYPSLDVISESVVLSLNEEYLCLDDDIQITLQTGDTVAIIPPISGG